VTPVGFEVVGNKGGAFELCRGLSLNSGDGGSLESHVAVIPDCLTLEVGHAFGLPFRQVVLFLLTKDMCLYGQRKAASSSVTHFDPQFEIRRESPVRSEFRILQS